MLGQNSVLDKLLSKTCSACQPDRLVTLLGHGAASEHTKVKTK